MHQDVYAHKPLTGPRLKGVAVVALAIAAGLAAWLLLERTTTAQERAAPAAPADGPRIMAADGLTALAATHGSAVFWAGTRPGTVYEVTQLANGYIYVRYLPSGTAPGDPRPDFLTIGTYPRPNAYGDVRAASRRPGAVAVRLPGGGLAVYDAAKPTSVYFAYRGVGQQVEVYDPSASRALRLVKTGAVRPVP